MTRELISRSKARKLGLVRFFTGEPCHEGHVAERYVIGARCVECAKLYGAWVTGTLEGKARNNERTRLWRETERGKELRRANLELPANRIANRDRTRAHFAKRYGFAPPPLERDCPPRPSDGRCDCCLKPITGRWHLDHCHETGAFRAWTCNACNTGTGIMDDPERLRSRLQLLEGTLPWQ